MMNNLPQFILDIEDKIKQASVYDKSKSDQHGEVFTPPELINEMLDQIPVDTFSDRTKTFFDPCAGLGQFPIQIVKRLMVGLENEIPNEQDRYKWIMENQLFMSEFQQSSADFIKETFEINGVKCNLYVGDTLTMPSDYFEIKQDIKSTVTTKKPFFEF